MGVRVAINGFDRTGRLALRAAIEHGSKLGFVAAVHGDARQLGHLLRYDARATTAYTGRPRSRWRSRETRSSMDLENAMAESMVKLIYPAREFFKISLRNLEKMKKMRVTRYLRGSQPS